MSEPTGRLITFSLAGGCYAMGLGETAEVLEDVPTFPVPMAPPFMGEAINCHGRIVPVLDLAAFMGLGAARGKGTILVLDQRLADLALRVGGTVIIVPVEAAEDEAEGDGGLVERHATVAGESLAILSPGRILQFLELMLNK